MEFLYLSSNEVVNKITKSCGKKQDQVLKTRLVFAVVGFGSTLLANTGETSSSHKVEKMQKEMGER
jgi:hypothetical protein